MYFDKNLWLNNIKTVAKRFIENNYSEELPLFDTFWQAFSAKINVAIKSEDVENISLMPMSRIITEISFAQGYSQDLTIPAATLTITEVLYVLNTKKHSAGELEDIIHSSSVRHGAKPSLTACLIRSLPALCNEILICKDNNSTEAIISEAPRPSQYRIWTEGKCIILNSIDNYKREKEKYLVWLDLDNPPKGLTNMSIKLLRYLVENIGVPTLIANIIQNVFDDIASENDRDGDVNKINQQLSKLEAFTAKRFRQYLMSGWPKESLGLSDDFRDKYFLFSRAALD